MLNNQIKNFLVFIFALSIISCGRQKAEAFKKEILKQQDEVTHMLIGKDGPESRKLEHLIKNDYQTALSLIDTQELAFNNIIKTIGDLKTENIKQAPELQRATVDYFTSLKNLHLSDRNYIEQEMLSTQLKGDAQSKAQDSLLTLSKDKQPLFQEVYKMEEAFTDKLNQFNKANGL